MKFVDSMRQKASRNNSGSSAQGERRGERQIHTGGKNEREGGCARDRNLNDLSGAECVEDGIVKSKSEREKDDGTGGAGERRENASDDTKEPHLELSASMLAST